MHNNQLACGDDRVVLGGCSCLGWHTVAIGYSMWYPGRERLSTITNSIWYIFNNQPPLVNTRINWVWGYYQMFLSNRICTSVFHWVTVDILSWTNIRDLYWGHTTTLHNTRTPQTTIRGYRDCVLHLSTYLLGVLVREITDHVNNTYITINISHVVLWLLCVGC